MPDTERAVRDLEAVVLAQASIIEAVLAAHEPHILLAGTCDCGYLIPCPTVRAVRGE